jgi:hypothetical protein
METILICVGLVVVAWLAHRAKKLGYFDVNHEAAQPAVVVKSPIGKWAGDIARVNEIAWGDPNDEHTPEYTAKTLAQEPSWRGMKYCPGGVFAFEVHADGSITGEANIYGHICPVQGRPVLAAGAMEIEFTVIGHWVRLKFDGDAVTGLLWEGHDLLKRANVVGRRA